MTLLSARAQLFRPGGTEFRRLAMAKCDGAFTCHRAALRHPSPAAFHLLRIALKRFRYCVENFLPKQHALWIHDLKVLQDLLGEVHDLDVLWTQLPEAGRAFDAQARLRWRARIHAEREKRLAKYRQKMTGKKSPWSEWRASLI